MPIANEKCYILDVIPDGPTIKILAQLEILKHEATQSVKDAIYNYMANFQIPRLPPSQITVGTRALVYFVDVNNTPAFHRVQVVDTKNWDHGSVSVLLVDDCRWNCQIELSRLCCCPPDIEAFPISSEVFCLADVAPALHANSWSDHAVNFLRSQLIGRDVHGTVYRNQGTLALFRPYDDIEQGQLLAKTMAQCGMAYISPSFPGLTPLPSQDSHYLPSDLVQKSFLYLPEPRKPTLPPTTCPNLCSLSSSNLHSQSSPKANNCKLSWLELEHKSLKPGTGARYLVIENELGRYDHCVVVYIANGPWKFYIRTKIQKELWQDLYEKVNSIVAKNSFIPFSPCDSEVMVLCKSQKLNEYCRGLYLDVVHGKMRVFLIDIGMIEELPPYQVWVLAQDLRKFPILIVPCHLQGLPSLINQQISQNFQQLVSNQPVSVIFENVAPDLIVNVSVELKTFSALKLITNKVFDCPSIITDEELILSHIKENFLYFQSSKCQDLLSNFQLKLQQKSQLDPLTHPASGQPCLATFSEDMNWYRALILDVEDGIKVRFIDYGNEELVSSVEYLKEIDSILISGLTSQATPCLLEGLEDKEFNEDEIFNWLGDENVIVTSFTLVTREMDGIPTSLQTIQAVSNTSRRSLNDFLLQKTQSIHISLKAMDHDLSSADSFPEVPIVPDLLKLCRVTLVESQSHFFVTFLQTEVDLEVKSAFPHDASLKRLPGSPIKCSLDTPLVGVSDDSFKAAVTREPIYIHFHRKMSDTWQVSILKLTPLSYDDVISEEVGYLEKHDEETEKEEFSGITSSSSLTMTYTVESPGSFCENSLGEFSGPSARIQTLGVSGCGEDHVLPLQPPLSSTETVFISYYDDVSNITWIQRNSDSLLLFELNAELDQQMPSAQNLKDPSPGVMCLCQSMEDGLLYRGQILSIKGADLVVHFVDYGNTEELPLAKVKSLSTSLLKAHNLAYSCIMKSLTDVQSLVDQEITVLLLGTEGDNNIIELMEVVEKPSDISEPCQAHHEEEISSSNQSISSFEPKLEIEVISNDENIIPILEPPTDIELQLLISNVEDDSTLNLQLCSNILLLDDLQQKLSTLASTAENFKESRNRMYCAARYSQDGVWYRAKVLLEDSAKEMCVVTFIDYGNVETFRFDELKVLPKSCFNLSAQSFRCNLYSDELLCILKGEEIKSQLEFMVESLITGLVRKDETCGYILINSLIDGESLELKLMEEQDPRKNEIIDDESRVCDILDVTRVLDIPGENLPVLQDFTGESISLSLGSTSPNAVGEPKGKNKLFITSTETEEIIWVQDFNQSHFLDELSRNIQTYMESEDPEPLDQAAIGTLVIGRFPLDGIYYRAEVLNLVDDGTVDAHYIDFGNDCRVTKNDIYALPTELSILPPQAFRCRLELSENKVIQESRDVIEYLISVETFEAQISSSDEGKVLSNLTIDHIPLQDVMRKLVSPNEEEFCNVVEDAELEVEVALMSHSICEPFHQNKENVTYEISSMIKEEGGDSAMQVPQISEPATLKQGVHGKQKNCAIIEEDSPSKANDPRFDYSLTIRDLHDCDEKIIPAIDSCKGQYISGLKLNNLQKGEINGLAAYSKTSDSIFERKDLSPICLEMKNNEEKIGVESSDASFSQTLVCLDKEKNSSQNIDSFSTAQPSFENPKVNIVNIGSENFTQEPSSHQKQQCHNKEVLSSDYHLAFSHVESLHDKIEMKDDTPKLNCKQNILCTTLNCDVSEFHEERNIHNEILQANVSFFHPENEGRKAYEVVDCKEIPSGSALSDVLSLPNNLGMMKAELTLETQNTDAEREWTVCDTIKEILPTNYQLEKEMLGSYVNLKSESQLSVNYTSLKESLHTLDSNSDIKTIQRQSNESESLSSDPESENETLQEEHSYSEKRNHAQKNIFHGDTQQTTEIFPTQPYLNAEWEVLTTRPNYENETETVEVNAAREKVKEHDRVEFKTINTQIIPKRPTEFSSKACPKRKSINTEPKYGFHTLKTDFGNEAQKAEPISELEAKMTDRQCDNAIPTEETNSITEIPFDELNSETEITTEEHNYKIEIPTAGQKYEIEIISAVPDCKIEIMTAEPHSEIEIQTVEPNGETDFQTAEPSSKMEIQNAVPNSQIEYSNLEPNAKMEIQTFAEPNSKMEIPSLEVNTEIEILTLEPNSEINIPAAEAGSKIKIQNAAPDSLIKYSTSEQITEMGIPSFLEPNSEIEICTVEPNSQIKIQNAPNTQIEYSASETNTEMEIQTLLERKSEMDIPAAEVNSEIEIRIVEPNREMEIQTAEPNSKIKIQNAALNSIVEYSTSEPSTEMEIPTAEPNHEIEIRNVEPNSKFEILTVKADSKIKIQNEAQNSQIEYSTSEANNEYRIQTHLVPNTEIEIPAAEPNHKMEIPTAEAKSEIRTVGPNCETKFRTAEQNSRIKYSTLELNTEMEISSAEANSEIESRTLEPNRGTQIQTGEADSKKQAQNAQNEYSTSEPSTKIRTLTNLEPNTEMEILNVNRNSEIEIQTVEPNGEIEICTDKPNSKIQIKNASSNSQIEYSISEPNFEIGINALLEPKSEMEIITAELNQEIKIPTAEANSEIKIPIIGPNYEIEIPTAEPNYEIEILNAELNSETEILTAEADSKIKIQNATRNSQIEYLNSELSIKMGILTLAEQNTEMEIPTANPNSEIDIRILEPNSEMQIRISEADTEIEIQNAAPASHIDFSNSEPSAETRVPAFAEPNSQMEIPSAENSEIEIRTVEPNSETQIQNAEADSKIQNIALDSQIEYSNSEPSIQMGIITLSEPNTKMEIPNANPNSEIDIQILEPNSKTQIRTAEADTEIEIQNAPPASQIDFSNSEPNAETGVSAFAEPTSKMEIPSAENSKIEIRTVEQNSETQIRTAEADSKIQNIVLDSQIEFSNSEPSIQMGILTLSEPNSQMEIPSAENSEIEIRTVEPNSETQIRNAEADSKIQNIALDSQIEYSNSEPSIQMGILTLSEPNTEMEIPNANPNSEIDIQILEPNSETQIRTAEADTEIEIQNAPPASQIDFSNSEPNAETGVPAFAEPSFKMEIPSAENSKIEIRTVEQNNETQIQTAEADSKIQNIVLDSQIEFSNSEPSIQMGILTLSEPNTEMEIPNANPNSEIDIRTVEINGETEFRTAEPNSKIKIQNASLNSIVEYSTSEPNTAMGIPSLVELNNEKEIPTAELNSEIDIQTLELNSEIEIPTAEANSKIKIQNAAQNSQIEYSTSEPNIELGIPTHLVPNSEIEIPATEPNHEIKIPTAEAKSEIKIPPARPNYEIEIRTAEPNYQIEILTAEPKSEIEIRTVGPNCETKFRTAEQNSRIEYSTLELNTEMGIPTFLEPKSEMEIPSAETNSQIESRTLEKNRETQIRTGKADSKNQIHNATQNAQIEYSTSEPSTEIGILTHLEPNIEMEIPNASRKSEIEIRTVEPNGEIEISTDEPNSKIQIKNALSNSQIEYSTSEPNFEIGINALLEPKSEMEIPTAELNHEIEIPPAEANSEIKIPIAGPNYEIEILTAEPNYKIEILTAEPNNETEILTVEANSKIKIQNAAPTSESNSEMKIPTAQSNSEIEIQTVEPKSNTEIQTGEAFTKIKIQNAAPESQVEYSTSEPYTEMGIPTLLKPNSEMEIPMAEPNNEIQIPIAEAKSKIKSPLAVPNYEIEIPTAEPNSQIGMPTSQPHSDIEPLILSKCKSENKITTVESHTVFSSRDGGQDVKIKVPTPEVKSKTKIESADPIYNIEDKSAHSNSDIEFQSIESNSTLEFVSIDSPNEIEFESADSSSEIEFKSAKQRSEIRRSGGSNVDIEFLYCSLNKIQPPQSHRAISVPTFEPNYEINICPQQLQFEREIQPAEVTSQLKNEPADSHLLCKILSTESHPEVETHSAEPNSNKEINSWEPNSGTETAMTDPKFEISTAKPNCGIEILTANLYSKRKIPTTDSNFKMKTLTAEPNFKTNTPKAAVIFETETPKAYQNFHTETPKLKPNCETETPKIALNFETETRKEDPNFETEELEKPRISHPAIYPGQSVESEDHSEISFSKEGRVKPDCLADIQSPLERLRFDLKENRQTMEKSMNQVKCSAILPGTIERYNQKQAVDELYKYSLEGSINPIMREETPIHKNYNEDFDFHYLISNGRVVHLAHNPVILWIQNNNDDYQIEMIKLSLRDVIQSGLKKLREIKVGKICCSFFFGDLIRAKILNVDASTVRLHFLDTGNISCISSENIFECPPSIAELPSTAKPFLLPIHMNANNNAKAVSLLKPYCYKVNCSFIELTSYLRSPFKKEFPYAEIATPNGNLATLLVNAKLASPFTQRELIHIDLIKEFRNMIEKS